MCLFSTYNVSIMFLYTNWYNILTILLLFILFFYYYYHWNIITNAYIDSIYNTQDYIFLLFCIFFLYTFLWCFFNIVHYFLLLIDYRKYLIYMYYKWYLNVFQVLTKCWCFLFASVCIFLIKLMFLLIYLTFVTHL